MAGTFHRYETAVHKDLHEVFALVKRDRVVLLAPNHQHRTRMLANTLELFRLIGVCIAGEFGEACAPEALVLHLIAIPAGPLGKALGMKEVAELAVRPGALVKN